MERILNTSIEIIFFFKILFYRIFSQKRRRTEKAESMEVAEVREDK